jgi:hypothetical protein
LDTIDVCTEAEQLTLFHPHGVDQDGVQMQVKKQTRYP